MCLINNLYGVAFAIARLAASAADVAGRRLAAANRGRALNVIGQMSDRQLQDVGLSPIRGSTLKNSYASAEAQLGMVR